MLIRKAEEKDLNAVAGLYDRIHDAEEAGQIETGWIRNVYPVSKTAANALERGDLFVLVDESEIRGCGIINQLQADVYAGAEWQYPAPDADIMVLHTLAIDPTRQHQGYGRAFVDFYAQYARDNSCRFLRMDTNVINRRARKFYKRLGFREIGTAPTLFNGIPDVELVLLEKALN